MTENPQTPAPDWDARAREMVARRLPTKLTHGLLFDYTYNRDMLAEEISLALSAAHASGLSETTAIAQRWRNDMAEACACIAERYEAHGPAADMRAMIRSLGAKE